MIDPLVPKAKRDQPIVTLITGGIDQAPSLDLQDGEVEEGLSMYILDDLDPNLSASFQDAENRNRAGSTAPSFSFSPSSEKR